MASKSSGQNQPPSRLILCFFDTFIQRFVRGPRYLVTWKKPLFGSSVRSVRKAGRRHQRQYPTCDRTSAVRTAMQPVSSRSSFGPSATSKRSNSSKKPERPLPSPSCGPVVVREREERLQLRARSERAPAKQTVVSRNRYPHMLNHHYSLVSNRPKVGYIDAILSFLVNSSQDNTITLRSLREFAHEEAGAHSPTRPACRGTYSV